MVKTVRATTAVLAKHAINCARKIAAFKKYGKNCARNLATTSATITLFSIILQSEPFMLKHVWGNVKFSKSKFVLTIGKIWMNREM